MSGQRKATLVSHGGSGTHLRQANYNREMDINKMLVSMEKGHRVCKINVLKKWDPAYKTLQLRQEMRVLQLVKIESTAVRSKPVVLDIRHIREVQTLDYKLNTIKIGDKWKRDKEIQNFDAQKILVISYGTEFRLNHWIMIFDTHDICTLWAKGLNNLMMDTRDRDSSCHTVRTERFLAKYFDSLKTPSIDQVARKHMKPFVQTHLQYKVQSKQLQDATEDQMNFSQFSRAVRQMIHTPTLFKSNFFELAEDLMHISFPNFLRFLEKHQNDDMAQNRARATEFLRRYLHMDHAFNLDRIEPSLTIMDFCDLLFSRENSVWDPMNEKVIQDMTKPLSHYWIASSHNTYLTGDQFSSESSLDSYAQALLMGCRCIELDCWDGQKKPTTNEFVDIVIYHGYTITSKLLLRDVLYTIKHYAFLTSEYPVILSIEDNCSVPAQRLLAQEVKEILGDYLLVTPVSRDEKELPSPAALKKKIILKHKKLPIENDELAVVKQDEFEDTDILARDCVKRGVLWFQDIVSNEWKTHVFVLFQDRLCYLLESCQEDATEDDISMLGEEDREEEEAIQGIGMRPEEMHVTEEWFHGSCERNEAAKRLLEHMDKGNGLFLVRNSNLFIGDFSLSFVHDGRVHHVRIKTMMVDREKKYYFLDTKVCDTLYELISYYTRHYLTTSEFVIALTTPCPQPQPHLKEPWFSSTANAEKAEELLNKVDKDGAFLIRTSSTDENVYVISIRVDGEILHYRLKREGRIFVVNQTVFENLNQIVAYYSTRDFVRGISLRFPVNENEIQRYASGDLAQAVPGCYMKLEDLNKQEIQAKALRPYHGKTDEDLSFPIDAIITVIRKEEGIWRGRYGAFVGWFPPAYVKEIQQQKSAKTEESKYATIELAGTLIEKCTEPARRHTFRVVPSGSHWTGNHWTMSATSQEEADEWYNQLIELTRSVNNKLSIIRTREKSARIAAELSNLVVYCQAVPFDPTHVDGENFYEMCSFVENKLNKLIEMNLVQFNMKQLSRVYPHGSRISSSNYNPVPMWNASCHMVALNYQTGDKSMQLNQGKFLGNGQCGYLLKPEYMLDPNFNPNQGTKVTTSTPIRLTINIIGARHLSRKDKNKGICSPFVEVEIIGLPCDDRFYKTRTIASNGLNPMWNESFSFELQCPEMALLRFYVEDGDFVGPKTDPFIGQAVFPVDCLRCGYRSIPLKNQFSEELELSALLIQLEMSTVDRNILIRNSRTMLQSNRMASVHRKITNSESIVTPTTPRSIAPGFRSMDGSLDEPMSPTNSAVSLMDRKQSSHLSQDSQDSFESSGTSFSNGNETITSGGKKKKKFIHRLMPFRSKEKD